jgi:hypothetical protein
MIYDGKDSLIIFGGSHAHGMDNCLFVFSLSTCEWRQPQQNGLVPSARTNHSAALIAPGVMLLFGGCNIQGVFFNDTFLLDTKTFTWHKPHVRVCSCHTTQNLFMYMTLILSKDAVK